MASKSVKDQLDKKYGSHWMCMIGEAFAFDVNYQSNSLLFMYYNGNIAVLVYKCWFYNFKILIFEFISFLIYF